MAIVIPYTKQTWTDGAGGGTPVSAARLGVIEEGILDVSLAPAVRVYHTASQSIGSGSRVALAFNSERFDQAGGAASTQHDTVTDNSRLTCRYAGVYLISGTIEWAASVSHASGADVTIRVDGATLIARQLFVSNDQRVQTVSTLYSLNVNQYVELTVLQNTGGSVNVNSTGNYSPEFSMVRVA